MPRPLRSDIPSPRSLQFAHFGVLDEGTQSIVSMLLSVLINLLLALVAILVSGGAKRAIQDPDFSKVEEAIGVYGARFVLVGAALAFGFLGSAFKRRWQYRCGVTEVFFSLA